MRRPITATWRKPSATTRRSSWPATRAAPLAALMAVAFGPEAVYLYGASSDAERGRMAPHATQWAAYAVARARAAAGATTSGEWPIPTIPHDPMAGVHRFKLGFNPRLVEYPGTYDLRAAARPLVGS